MIEKMKILACCKVVPDLEMLTDEDWVVRDMEVELRFAKREWNVFDESVLEMALRLRDAYELLSGAPSEPVSAIGEIELTALNIGDAGADPFLKTLLALRYDRAVRIDPGEQSARGGDLRFSPAAVAELIAAFARKHGYDLLLFGRQSGVGDNGQTPMLTAELLGLPCITQVRAVRPVHSTTTRESGASRGGFIVESYTDDGVLEQEIVPPCVLAVGNAEQTYLRVPTLKDKMKFGARPVEVLRPEEILSPGEVLNPEGYRLTRLERIDTSRAGELISGGSVEEKARKVYDLYLKKRLEKIWTTR